MNKKTKRVSKAQPSAMNVAEMADWLMGNVPELKEAFTRADIELALDDRGWMLPGRQSAQADLDAQSRTVLVGKARLYWLRDPLAKQAVRLWTDYALGTGITYNTEDAAVMKKLDAFMKDRRNKRILNSEGQRKHSKKLLVDGELFFAVFTEPDGRRVIRPVDPLQITDIICDPDDDEHILGYLRKTANDTTLCYADWTCEDEDITLLAQQKDRSTGQAIKEVEQDVVMYHIAFDTLAKRGNGLLFPVVDWSKEHRRFMEARVAITQALAKFAWNTKIKGGQGAVNQVVAQLQSTYVKSGATQVERNPQTAPGGQFVHNDGIDMTPVARTTGAGDAATDGNQLKLMVSAGTGIMLHYFGDPSTGNLATATAMELPMLKMFEAYQQLWMDAYRDLFAIVLEEDIDEEPADIDIDLPPILADDLQKMGTFLTAIGGLFPELKVPEVLQMCLISLGVNNLDEVMKKIAANKVEIDKQQAEQFKLQQAQAVAGKQPPAPGTPPKPIVKKPAVSEAAITKLAEALSGFNRTQPTQVAEAAPINLAITIDNKQGKTTRKGTAKRDPKSGEIKMEMEEE